MNDKDTREVLDLVDEYAFQVRLMFPEAPKILLKIESILSERRNEYLEEAAVICETAPDYLQNSTFDGVAAYIRSRKTK